jgi:hypothetical protein
MFLAGVIGTELTLTDGNVERTAHEAQTLHSQALPKITFQFMHFVLRCNISGST